MPNPPILRAKLGSVGHRLTVPMDQSLSSYTSAQMSYIDPDGNEGVWTASLDTTNNDVYYLVTSGDLDTEGTWTLTGRAIKTGYSIYSPPMLLQVFP